MRREGTPLSATSVSKVLREAGLPRLPRRTDPSVGPETAPLADRREFSLEPGRFRTGFGGLFLFVPFLAQLPLERLFERLPGSARIPARCAMLSMLALKLHGIGRPPRIMPEAFDRGLALFSGLNAFPKRSTLTEYTCRVDPRDIPGLMSGWFDATRDLPRGDSIDLDFHTIPGDRALVEKHSKRCRHQKGILARDADARVFCYANAKVRKEDQNHEILRFVEYWKERHGAFPKELVFDSRLTTQAVLGQLDAMGIRFLTLRRRSAKMVQALGAVPANEWKRVRLSNVGRIYRNPRVFDQRIALNGYPGEIRQLAIADLGHEEPTLLLTNQMEEPIAPLIDRYARRMVIENAIAEAIEFFHMDALSAAVPMKIDVDLQLTLMAGTLYRLFAMRVGNGYEKAKAATLFRNFVGAVAQIEIADGIQVRFGRRANNPLLLNANFGKETWTVPWLADRTLSFVFD